MTGADRERADTIGETEFKQIVVALQPKPAPPAPPPPPSTPTQKARQPSHLGPARPADQVKLVQQALIDQERLHGKADGVAGPATRLAIREFEKSAGLPSTGEPSRSVYLALVKAHAASRWRSSRPTRRRLRPRPTSPSRPMANQSASRRDQVRQRRCSALARQGAGPDPRDPEAADRPQAAERGAHRHGRPADATRDPHLPEAGRPQGHRRAEPGPVRVVEGRARKGRRLTDQLAGVVPP